MNVSGRQEKVQSYRGTREHKIFYSMRVFKRWGKESLLPFPAWRAGNMSPFFPHFYPVILNPFPNKLYYYVH
jgi:hypothetical protein